ncbi:Sodium/potassium/calcium exchanger 2 (Na(+)/K(+)/Ca(2+)-exchange protein 2) (Retinal cone Na-Ca+K exchanger) (Solute carrier family 24 member 2), partial [Durusdinium trenchii]
GLARHGLQAAWRGTARGLLRVLSVALQSLGLAATSSNSSKQMSKRIAPMGTNSGGQQDCAAGRLVMTRRTTKRETKARIAKKLSKEELRRMRRRAKYGHFRFNRKSLIKYQMVFFIAMAVYALLPENLGRLSMSDVLGPTSSEDIGFSRRLSGTVDDACNTTTEEEEPEDLDSYDSGEFPDDFMTLGQKRNGGIIVHIFIMFYMFLGLAIVCDEYFESALEAICENLHLKEDVAGATFMAAGGSAPELFSSFIGVFVAKNDIGFGTIVGSATFNVLFVIALCAFVTGNLTLSWWPLTRDCVYYCLSIVVLVGCVIDQEIDTLESILLLFMYVGYITVMYFNEQLESWVGRKLEDAARPRVGLRLKLEHALHSDAFNYFIYVVIVSNIVVIFYESFEQETQATGTLNNICSGIFISEMVLKMIALSFFGYWHNAVNAFDGTLVVLILIEMMLSSSSVTGGLRALRVFRFLRIARVFKLVRLYFAYATETADAATQTEQQDWEMMEKLSGISPDQLAQVVMPQAQIKSSAAVAPMKVNVFDNSTAHDESELKAPSQTMGGSPVPRRDDDDEGNSQSDDGSSGGNDDDDDDDDGPAYPFEIPDGGKFDVFMWALALPLSAGMYFTIPDCRREIFDKYYFATFIMCIVWIAALSYLMIWMATLFGKTAFIPDPVMGLTIIAAGTSVPDLLSSLAVAKRGFGDMAVSSSVGSNIFDILIGLPVPWFMSTTVVRPGSVVLIHSDGLTIMVLTLFLMVAAVVSIIHWSGWVLTRKLGWAMISLYVLFLIESLLLEYGFLGTGCEV